MNKKIVYPAIGFIIILAITFGYILFSQESTIYKGNIPQGTFKAMIGNQEIFTNGPDIINVTISESTDIMADFCVYDNEITEYFCPFKLGFIISNQAAKRQAKATANLEVIQEGEFEYLSENLTLYFKDKNLDELRISSEMKGLSNKYIQISGSGIGKTEEDAIKDAKQKYLDLVNVLSDNISS